jgi:hypothetical protein
MPEHVHVHQPHELNEGNEGATHRERALEIVAAFLLALTTLAIAWSGYQAARWSGLQAERYTQASAARSLATRAETDGDEEQLQDLLNFNRWLEASTTGNEPIAELYQRRFREEFRPAFDAWVAQGDPINDPTAISTPLQMPEYVLSEKVESDRLERVADLRFEQGRKATENADEYVFTTVFFAAVLFFSGISLRFEWMNLRIVMLGLAVVFLIYGLAKLATMPTH